LGRFEAASAAKEVGEDQVLTVVAALQVKDQFITDLVEVVARVGRVTRI
jgi:hypothetical protein